MPSRVENRTQEPNNAYIFLFSCSFLFVVFNSIQPERPTVFIQIDSYLSFPPRFSVSLFLCSLFCVFPWIKCVLAYSFFLYLCIWLIYPSVACTRATVVWQNSSLWKDNYKKREKQCAAPDSQRKRNSNFPQHRAKKWYIHENAEKIYMFFVLATRPTIYPGTIEIKG